MHSSFQPLSSGKAYTPSSESSSSPTTSPESTISKEPTFSLDAFFEEPLQDIMAIYHHINQQVFSLSDCKLQGETLQKYIEQGLIVTLPVPALKEENPLFSFKDKVWLTMIGHMESFGFSSITIGKVKENLFTMIGIEEVFALIASSAKAAAQAGDILQGSPLSSSHQQGLETFLQDGTSLPQVSMSLFELLLIHAIALKQESELMILSCGTVLPLLDEMHLLDDRISQLKMQPHLSLSFNAYVLEYVSCVSKALYQSRFKLKSEEVEIVRQIRSGLYKEVKVEFNHDRQLTAIEMVQDKTLARHESLSVDKMIQSGKYHKVNFTSNHERGGHLQRVYRKKFSRGKVKK